MKFFRVFTISLILVLVGISTATAETSSEAYKKGSDCFHEARHISEKGEATSKWNYCIKLFKDVYKRFADSPEAPRAVFSSGIAFRKIYKDTGSKVDAKSAIAQFDYLLKNYSSSRLADDALFNIGTLRMEALGQASKAKDAMWRIIRLYPEGDMVSSAESYLEAHWGEELTDKNSVWQKQKVKAKVTRPTSKYTKLEKIERREFNDSDEVIFHFSSPVQYVESYGSHSVSNNSLFTLELENTYISRLLNTGYSYIGKGVIRDITPSQVSKFKAQVNIVIKKDHHCVVSPKESDLRVSCKPGAPIQRTVAPSVAPAPMITETEDIELSKEKKRKSKLSIVIDPGHGGHDEGAIGPKGTREKDIALQIAKRLGWQLRNKYNMDVNYTRIDDRFITLDDRNTIADGHDADLFISIHANAAESSKLDGYQTFFLNNTTDKASRRLAARENASLGKSMDDVEQIVLTMMQNLYTDQSRSLAKSVHKKVLSKMSKYGLKDRGVKSALFYVLVGAKCPSVLIETSFISNPTEEQRLKNSDYQENIVKGIAQGINDYVTKSKSFRDSL